MLTVAHPLKTFLQNGLKGWKKEKDRICSMWKREVPAWERLGGGGGSVPRLRLCSKSGTYVITASSTGHFFQESGPSSFYLKLWVLWHTHTHTPPSQTPNLVVEPSFPARQYSEPTSSQQQHSRDREEVPFNRGVSTCLQLEHKDALQGFPGGSS